MKTAPLLACALAALLAGCATQPKPLQGAYAPLSAQDAAVGDHAGTLVRWGGRIIRTEPGKDRTCFEVLSMPLGADGRPREGGDQSLGRFQACRPGFYDPALFQPEREVTFTGRIDGYEQRNVAAYAYRFPRLAADVVYLWPERQRVNVIERDPWPRPWGWWYW
jgi:outer membrane lipoprotein